MEKAYTASQIAEQTEDKDIPYFLKSTDKETNQYVYHVHYPKSNFTAFHATDKDGNSTTFFLHTADNGIYYYIGNNGSISFIPINTDNLKKLNRFPILNTMLSIPILTAFAGKLWNGPISSKSHLMLVNPILDKNPDYKRFNYQCNTLENSCTVSSFSLNKDERVNLKVGDEGFNSYKNLVNKRNIFSEKYRRILERQCQKLSDNNFRQWIKRLTADLNNTCGVKAQHMLPDISEVSKLCTMIDPMWGK